MRACRNPFLARTVRSRASESLDRVATPSRVAVAVPGDPIKSRMNVRCSPKFIAPLLLFPLILSGRAAEPAEKPAVDESLYCGMKWRLAGPFRGGRALAVQGVVGEPNVYYFGAVAGGVWKTMDGGQTWAPLFQKEAVSSIGDIGIAQSDHNVIYVGTGEAAIRGDITFGDGVYKSVDGGRNWKNIGLKDSRHIGALIVHPTNPDIVFVAALGHAFGPNSERGIFKTTDGGRTWRNVLSKDENTGGIDIVFDPHNPNVLFAALWQARREPFFPAADRVADCIVRSMAAKHGNISRSTACPMESSDESGSPFHVPIQIASMR